MEQFNLSEYRCDCGKLLFKGDLKDCRVEIKCRRCGEIKTIDFSDGKRIENRLCNLDVSSN